MSATLLSVPTTPASVYRPMQYRMQATSFFGGAEVSVIEIADASDVSTHGNGLEVGDILVTHANMPVGHPAVAGEAILVQGCGQYDGLRIIEKVIDQSGGTNYLTIVAPNYGDHTPVTFGSLRPWANGYTFYLQLSIYTDGTDIPQTARLKATPDLQGIVTFNVAPALKDFFSSDISSFAASASGLFQSATGTTAVFYKAVIAEVWDDPDETEAIDPFDGTHTVHTDSANLVAVNAVHPYASAVETWATDGMGSFVIGSPTSRFLTMAHRDTMVQHTMGVNDRFRLHMLTDSEAGHIIDFNLVIELYDTPGGTATGVSGIYMDPAGEYPAFSIAVGPADLAAYVTLPASHYTVTLKDGEGELISEVLRVKIDRECKENRRRFLWLGKLGGVEQYTFTGREIGQSKVRRATVQKPYGAGVGYDFMERTYRAEVDRSRTVSTGAVNDQVRRWIAEDLCESPAVCVEVESMICPAIILSSSVPSFNTANNIKPVTIEYQAGVDNLSQQG